MCRYRAEDGACKLLSDGSVTEYCVEGPCPDDTPTNADRIRTISDEKKRDALIAYFCRWACTGDSYIYDLGREKSAFGVGTMGFEDFAEWDESRVAELVDELLDWLQQPTEEG